jgi:hypothetical protein
MGTRRVRWISGVAGAGLLASFLCSAPAHAQADATTRDARTARLCANCHRDKFAALQHNAHTVLGDEDWQARTG